VTAISETPEFQAEARALLDMMTHSLYTDKEIFLREMVSNASDALDRLRFEPLTNSDLLEGDNKFEIRLDVDRAPRAIMISDSGIGMGREEVFTNIRLITRSGTCELRRFLGERGSTGADAAELIGPFGVGFYSVFMVADRVELHTKRARGSVASEWESGGDGAYPIREYEKADRGTSITPHLKPPDPDNEIQDYPDHWRLGMHHLPQHLDEGTREDGRHQQYRRCGQHDQRYVAALDAAPFQGETKRIRRLLWTHFK
jgi:molecular chaperone HtpG